jgi:UDP-N-acetylmuramoyl-tripeptide--D-alanyl-D-alanine ligase
MVSPEKIYELFYKHPAISTDSRKIEPGCIFFALQGDRFDGNRFAENAILMGAAYAVVDDRNVVKNDHYLLVENVLASLQQLSLKHRRHFSIPVIGITGSNGKTTTKELISAVLSRKYTTLATTGNLNNHIGVPLTLLMLNESTEIAVIEMGANHPGEIGFLCNLALPDYGIITNVGKAHLEGLVTLEGVIRTKTELYRYLQSTGGKVFININNGILVEHTGTLQKITYGAGSNAEVNGKFITSQPFIRFTLNIGNNSVEVSSKLFGDYNLENLLAAACIGNYFGVSVEKIKSTLENYEPSNNRSQVIQSERNKLILDAYNANPTSMQAALNNFSSSTFNNKVVIFGDMLELGEASDEEHLNILRLLEKTDFSGVYLVGPTFTRLNTKIEWLCFQDSELASLWFSHHKLSGSTILVKGSRGIKMERIIKEL